MQLFFFTLLILFQNPDLQTEPFRHYDSEAGLSNNIVYDIFQDKDGFMWIATENGLNRFDGYEFKKYFHDNEDSRSLSSNIVRSIREDKEGNLWIGTYNGLNLFNKEKDNFTRFVELPSVDINRLDLQQMIIDREGSRIWFCSLEATGWFDIEAKKFHFLSQIENPFSISLDDSGNFWIQSFEGELYRYEIETSKLSKIHSDKLASQSLIFRGNYSEKFWSGTNLNTSKLIERPFKIPELLQKALPLKLLERNEQELMIASDDGLFSYSLNDGGLKKIGFGEKSSSLTNSIRSIFQDRNGGLWVGTLNGFFHFDPYQKPFIHIDVIEKRSDVIMGLHHIEQQLFVNTFSQGLKSYDLDTEEFEEVLFNESHEIGFFQIWDIEWVPESQYSLWLATNEGLFLYNRNSKKVKKVDLEKDGEKFPVTFSIANTEEKYLWVSSLTALYKLSKKSGEIEQIITIDGKIISSIQDIQIHRNMILIATEGEGIFIYKPEKSDFLTPLDRLIPEASSLLKLPIWDVFLGSDEVIWIGTNQGLFKLKLESLTLIPAASDVLKSRVIFSIEEDEQGNLWLGTEKGLIRFNPISEEILEFNKSDGVVNVEFNRRSVTKSENGRLFFGGVEGISSFNPNSIITNLVPPEVHILEARIVTSDSVFMPDGFYEGAIFLPWDKNTLEFNFVGLNYTNPSLNKYRYKLEGHDPDWVDAQTNRLARYAQLPHGDYVFKVQASNNDGLWNVEGASLAISISPPIWKTIWFRILVLILIMGILWTGYRYRLNKLLELERVKLRIASDLHDEVGSGLSGIALTGDILQRQFEKGQIKPELIQRITKNSRVLASSLDAIVWLIDSKKETVGDLISKSLITAKDLIHDAKLEVIDAVSKADQAKVLTSLQRRNLFLLIKEALNNIAKHSKAKKVTLEFRTEEYEFFITLKDDGNGFDKKLIENGRGLGTMKSRAEELDANFSLKSDSKDGTKIIVSIKIP